MMGPKIKTGVYVVCERPDATGERFLGKVAQYTPGDPHCYTIEYIIEDDNRVKRGKNEFVVEVETLIVLPKESFKSVSSGSKTIVRIVRDISNLLKPKVSKVNLTSSASSDENKRKKKKVEIEELETSESEWEEYQPELWERTLPIHATHSSSGGFGSTTTPSSAPTPTPTTTTTQTQEKKFVDSYQKIDTSSTEETSTNVTNIEYQKPQRKQRIPRDVKRDMKNDIRAEIQLSQMNNSLFGVKHHLPGVISCPNKRYKAAVEIKGKLIQVPGLFDSDVEAAVARDEFLVRKYDAITQTTFRVDETGPLFYGYGLLDTATGATMKRRETDSKRSGGAESTSSRNELTDSSSVETGPQHIITNSLNSAVDSEWWWDQIALEHVLGKESPSLTS